MVNHQGVGPGSDGEARGGERFLERAPDGGRPHGLVSEGREGDGLKAHDFVERQAGKLGGIASRDHVLHAGIAHALDEPREQALVQFAVRAVGRDVDAGYARQSRPDALDAHAATSRVSRPKTASTCRFPERTT